MSSDFVTGLSAANRAPDVQVWLAGPAARRHFHVETQTPEDRLRWQQIRSERRRAEWEVSRALLIHARQTLPAGAFRLSLAHSGGYASVASAPASTHVGVDLEVMRERDFLRLARFAFSAGEVAELEALPVSARAERFYILWTLKEAFAKALSLPLLQSVSRCTFSEARGAWSGSVPTANAWSAKCFRPQRSFVVSVVMTTAAAASPQRLQIATHEWPAPHASSWLTLASLDSQVTNY
jgi:4'-phosphopantetheinyl transferase